MGSAHAPAPIDFRVEKCMNFFELPHSKIERLWYIFLTNDQGKRGLLTYQDFLQKIIDYPRSPLTDNLPGLIDLKSEAQMNFGEFVELVCTICFFEEHELLKYFFYVLDQHRTGFVDVMELKHLLLTIHTGDRGLIREAVEHLEECASSNPTYNFLELVEFRQMFPYAFHPLFRLQTQMMMNTLGINWWETHKINKYAVKAELAAKQRADMAHQEEQKRKEESLASDEVLKKRMGIRYYLMPWMRAVEERKLLRIAAIEDELAATGRSL